MCKNIFNIAANLPFLDSLANSIIKQYGDNPLVFSNITIFLPSRRACAELSEAFLRASEGKPMLLPSIQPLGDLDDEEFLFRNADNDNLEIPNIISATRQRLILTELIEKWQSMQSGHETITTVQAAHLAIELASFLSEVQKQQLSFSEIENIVPDELSKHWQTTLNFLSILIEKWPDILEDNKVVDIHTHRNLSLEVQAEYWRKNPSEYPVIAAGSTGSIPATANLLKVIASMENGQVILPGLDIDMDEESWEHVSYTHPQYGFKNLLESFGIARDKVQPYPCYISSPIDRNKLICQIMLPFEVTDRWNKVENVELEQFEGIEIINSSSLQEEATVIALKMKQVLQEKHKTAALVTNRRDLAKRVSAILQKWNVQIDDSAGYELSNTAEAVFLRLVANMVADKATNPVSVLNMLKNPFANCAFDARTFRDNVRKLEISCMRGVRSSKGFKDLYGQIDQSLTGWLNTVEETLKPMLKLMSLREVAFDEILKAHIKIAQEIANNDVETGVARLWSSNSGGQLKEFVDELLICAKDFKKINPIDYAGLFDALLAGQTFRQPYGSHPRLYILSPIEARMLRFDLVILGELNEGSWPMSGKSDPWMSRPMRNEFGLPLPEKKIGQSAHDFAQLLSSPNILITRSEKLDGTQTIPSRWLSRMDAILNILNLQDMVKPDQPWVKWARLLDKPENMQRIEPPCPNPPIEARPRKLSVTAIEKLMRDPYWIYANKILNLRKLDDIDKEPGGAEFGNFVHDALEEFVNKYDSLKPEEYYNYLLEQGKIIIEKQDLKPAIVSFWWPRFKRIAMWMVQNEEQRRKSDIAVLCEIKGKYLIQCGDELFTLEARADRFEVDDEGNITIIDYKTGTVPSVSDVKAGLSPQMTLEGVIADNKGFEKDGKVKALEYWKISGGQNEASIQNIGGKKATDLDDILADATEGVGKLVNKMFFEDTPFICSPNSDKVLKYNDYEHLERIKEWAD